MAFPSPCLILLQVPLLQLFVPSPLHPHLSQLLCSHAETPRPSPHLHSHLFSSCSSAGCPPYPAPGEQWSCTSCTQSPHWPSPASPCSACATLPLDRRCSRCPGQPPSGRSDTLPPLPQPPPSRFPFHQET